MRPEVRRGARALQAGRREGQAAKRGRRCGDEDGNEATLADIAGEAQAAVTTCSAFKDVIKNSRWAAPLRDQLATTLGYSALTGAHDSDADLLGGRRLEKALAASVTMYGPAPGAYGNTGRIMFDEGGRGRMGILALSESDGSPYWGHTDMRWSVEVATDRVIVTVVAEYENETEKAFKYELKKGESFYGADNLVLELMDAPEAPGAFQKFDSFPSECEA